MADLHGHLADRICRICNKTVQTVYDLKKHILTHVEIVNQIGRILGTDFVFTKDLKGQESQEDRTQNKCHYAIKETALESPQNHIINHDSEQVSFSSHDDEESNGENESTYGLYHESALYINEKAGNSIKMQRNSEAKLAVENKELENEVPESDGGNMVSQQAFGDDNITGADQVMYNGRKSHSFTLSKESLSTNGSLSERSSSQPNSKFTCNVCNKQLVNESSLIQHNLIHSDTNLYVLEECGAMFLKPCHLQEHKLVRPHDGSLCNSKFTNADNINRHLSTHQKDVMSCKSCNKTSEAIELLSLHLKRPAITEKSVNKCIPNASVDQVGYSENQEQSQQETQNSKEYLVSGSILPTTSPKKIISKSAYMVDKGHHKLYIDQMEKPESKDSTQENHTHKEHPVKPGILSKNGFLTKTVKRAKRDFKKKSMKVLKCTICDKIFDNPASLQNHGYRHTGERPNPCTVCGKGFVSKRDLREHMVTHATNKRYTCELCGKEFNHLSSLKTHRQSHSGEKRYTCEICGNSYLYESNLWAHKKVHLNDKWNCDMCNKNFSTRKNLQYHIRAHLERRAQTCHICGKIILGGGGHLNAHILLHSDVKPHVCEFCGKKFTELSGLKKHVGSHSDEQPFSCDQCEKRFKRREYLKRHKLIHTGKKPYKCDICEKTFRQPGSVKVHMRNVHSGI